MEISSRPQISVPETSRPTSSMSSPLEVRSSDFLALGYRFLHVCRIVASASFGLSPPAIGPAMRWLTYFCVAGEALIMREQSTAGLLVLLLQLCTTPRTCEALKTRDHPSRSSTLDGILTDHESKAKLKPAHQIRAHRFPRSRYTCPYLGCRSSANRITSADVSGVTAVVAHEGRYADVAAYLRSVGSA